MTNDEINRYIHVEIMGKSIKHQRISGEGCTICGLLITNENEDCRCLVVRIPEYTADSSPRELVNAVVAKFDKETAITWWIRLGRLVEKPNPNGGTTISEVDKCSANAETIARACVEAWKAGTEAKTS